MTFTLTSEASCEEEVRKSRFLALAAPVTSVEAAMAFIERVSVPTATHNCWAWKLGNQYRFNDDGEPGGTAGRPILAAIEGQECDQVVVVVIRWYGGIKLGTGGLVRAYGGCAARCLQQADKQPLVVRETLGFACTYAEWPLIKARLTTLAVVVLAEDYQALEIALQIAVEPQRRHELATLLANVSSGRIVLRAI
ncbi:IMPACT family protein [Pseudomonas rhizoryzae]|uniref:IMPACT family protein n=1 Tax=Pseudomonas rhizoryzae TaxID=2571129 RepID=UPI000735EACB|nr:YigZ family protein [Pseudomonas rhizoryzae]KTT27480.1 thymidylate synthase [Pseudomonas psychrotolerans]KTT27533.1 thymidylate synthase [Pseudomonas psychrotolerans]